MFLDKENLDEDGQRRELRCLAIAAKRYALFNQEGDRVTIRKATEHGLGAYLPPTDPETGQRVMDWIDRGWEGIVREALEVPVPPSPEWTEQVATTRLAISTPVMLGWFKRWNAADPKKPDGDQKSYRDQVKPFGFLQHAPLGPGLGRPVGTVSAAKLNLVAPYGERRWWINLHDPEGPRHRIVTYQPTSGEEVVVVGQTYGDLIGAHPFHPEPKSLGPDELPCHKGTVGLLSRRPMIANEKRYVGKEANELERVETGLVDELKEVLTVYERDNWDEVRRVLAAMPVEWIMAETGYSRRQAFYVKSGKRRPSYQRLPAVLAAAGAFSKRSENVAQGAEDPSPANGK